MPLRVTFLCMLNLREKSAMETFTVLNISSFTSSLPEVFLGKGVLNICSKFTGEHPCQSAISLKLQVNFFEITLRYGCFLVNWLHVFRTPFLKNTPGWLLLKFKGNAQFVKKVAFEPLMDFKQNHYGKFKIL